MSLMIIDVLQFEFKFIEIMLGVSYIFEILILFEIVLALLFCFDDDDVA